MTATDGSQQDQTRDFHHPYTPYDIQNGLMNAIYTCIDGGNIGIFESPTGTGKTLSLICGSLTWLRTFQEKTLQGELSTDETTNEPAWVVEHDRKEKNKNAVKKKSALEARLKQIRAKERYDQQRYENREPARKRLKTQKAQVGKAVEDISEFELAEYSSDDESKPTKSVHSESSKTGLSTESQRLMEKLGLVSETVGDEELPSVDEVKIFFCSRTHSQLTQFVQELRRVQLPEPSWTAIESDAEAGKQVGKVVIKHLPLGSRKNLCINHKVSALGSVQAINERCLEMQQPKLPKDEKCSFLPSTDTETLVNDFRDHTLADVRDIEDLGSLGKKIGICPYYASRPTIKSSEIVTLPYPLLLQKSAREALGLSLKGHVIIIDEAHNLMDTIANIHSVTITANQLKRCRSYIGVYLQKFRNRLKGKNRVYIAQVVRFLDSLAAYLDSKSAGAGAVEGVAGPAELMAGKGVDQINLYKLVQYLQGSKLARKVEGYVVYEDQQEIKHDPLISSSSRPSTMPVLTHVQSFIQTLTNPAAEGRYFYGHDDRKELFLKYTLLDPTFHFKEIVEEARAVILAGGTMSPMEDYTQHLFSYLEASRIQTFGCGHIIPKENLLALPVIQGRSGIDLEFTFEKRNTPAMIEGLGESVVDISARIPDGLVIFFPSYGYLDQVVALWETRTIWTRLQNQKSIFREPKSGSVEAVLASYSEAISRGRGGLLLSVIGGKLSEGINFSDALGRGVVVVGMPYANVHTAQWKAKLEYIEQSVAKRTGKRDEGKAAAREFVENACMRAVNQSIGRAIRHKEDYASILLLDKRYKHERIERKLPTWIRQGIDRNCGGRIAEVTEALSTFFKGKQRN